MAFLNAMSVENFSPDPILYVSDARTESTSLGVISRIDLFVKHSKEVLKLSFYSTRNGIVFRADAHLDLVRANSALSRLASRAAGEVLKSFQENS
jgi:hypothetical protein